MRRARDLRHSGSDIVVEEDLANVFGRCSVSLTLSSSFKTVITKSTLNVPLLECIPSAVKFRVKCLGTHPQNSTSMVWLPNTLSNICYSYIELSYIDYS